MSDEYRHTFRAWARHIRFLVVCACLLGSPADLGRSQSVQTNDDSVRNAPVIHVLESNAEFERPLHLAPPEEYRVDLVSGNFVRLIIEATSADINVELHGPDGRRLFEYYHRQKLTTPISWIAEEPGTYRVLVRPVSESSNILQRYKLSVTALRDPSSDDRLKIDAERAFATAEVLRSRWDESSFRQALNVYDDALIRWRAIHDVAGEVETLNCIGEVCCILGAYSNAVDFYRRAVQLGEGIGSRRLKIDAINGLGYAYLRNADNRQALKSGELALRLSGESKDLNSKSQAFYNVGAAHYYLSEMDQALDLLDRSLKSAESNGDFRGQAQALVMISYVLIDRGSMREAAERNDRARILWRAANDRQGEAMSVDLSGVHRTFEGEYQGGLSLHNEAFDIFRRIGDRRGEAIAQTGLGYTYFNLGDLDKSLYNYKQAAAFYHETANKNYEAVLLSNIGDVYSSSGDNAKAIDTYKSALPLIRNAHDTQWEALTLNSIGKAYLSSGEDQEALKQYEQALGLFREVKNRRWEANALKNIGSVFEKRGRIKAAIASYVKALELSRSVGDQWGVAEALYGKAHAQNSSGEQVQARHETEEAIRIIESIGKKMDSADLRASYLASEHPCYELYIDVLMGLHRVRPTEGFDALAFEASERARARVLLEALDAVHADIREGIDPALLERERSLLSALNAKAERQMAMLSGPHEEGQAEVLANEIAQLTIQNDEVKGQIRAASPHYAALTQARTLSLHEIQEHLLNNDSLLLEYSLGDERSYLWVVSRTDIASFELPGRKEIEASVRRLHNLLTISQPLDGESYEQRRQRVKEAGDKWLEESAVLGKLLLGPIGSRLGSKRLLVVADGALQYIPFQALIEPQATAIHAEEESTVHDLGSQGKLLLVNHEIVNEPSASALVLLMEETKGRQAAPKTVAVIADPVFEADDPRIPYSSTRKLYSSKSESAEAIQQVARDLGVGWSKIPRLVASRQEAEAIMALAPSGERLVATDFEANRGRATSLELAKYRIVHFATHGFLNNQHPELSGVVLSLFDKKGEPQDGFLRLHDIYNLKLPVDLVVLSACNSGLGKDVKGEGLIGLTRGFMYAGASSVVASLWKVDDEATSELMRHFYGYMLRDGLSPAAALRKAQVTMSQQKRWQSPYYWAGFVIQGQYLPTERVSSSSSHRIALWLITAAIISAVAFYALKRRRKFIL